ncbi:MAG: peptide chain release factor N(5)-glutamine methyltransferase [Alphaproteobacteria bacterium]|nr:MAG: peptide chain release factor N(5)-glutamine methyltransferase [Alphaproteobacteria bacterium]
MSNMSVADIYKDTKDIFAAAEIETAALDARLLLLDVLGMTREEWVAQKDMCLTQAQVQKMQDYRTRRLAGEPVSRILGRRGFYGAEFLLSGGTLDPRPDTETLIETVLQELGARKDAPFRLLDLGTGTGCIALTLLNLCPKAEAVAVDIAEDAVKTARENARLLRMEERCNVHVLDWTAAEVVKKLGRFDVVVSNPPYIRSGDMDGLSREVREFDPVQALDGGADGLDCYRDIFRLLPAILAEEGLCAFEIGYDQADDLRRLCEESGFSDIGCAKDLAGRDRCIFFRHGNKEKKQQETA